MLGPKFFFPPVFGLSFVFSKLLLLPKNLSVRSSYGRSFALFPLAILEWNSLILDSIEMNLPQTDTTVIWIYVSKWRTEERRNKCFWNQNMINTAKKVRSLKCWTSNENLEVGKEGINFSRISFIISFEVKVSKYS